MIPARIATTLPMILLTTVRSLLIRRFVANGTPPPDPARFRVEHEDDP